MRIDIAIHTAQEGYAWQPGSAISMAELREYKAMIGKFPSPDDPEMPFGGVFLKDEKVVFYRYHIAKKIDFLGRDALYCALGTVSVTDSDKINPRQLFSLPEFAGPMRPFPTVAQLPEASCEDVPEWLKNLDVMSLDVRITGTVDNMKFAVQQERVKPPAPEQDANSSATVATVENPMESVKPVAVVSETMPSNEETARPSYADVLVAYTPHKSKGSRKHLLLSVVDAIVVLILLCLVVFCCVKMMRGTCSAVVQDERTEQLPNDVTNKRDVGFSAITNANVVKTQTEM